MQFKKSLLAAAMFVSGAAFAAPTLQTCNPMEVLHDGGAGMSYRLKCIAADWDLTYTGSVPSGTKAVDARYKLSAFSASGESFVQNRTVRLTSPADLGLALLREAVVFETGELALRSCEEFNCSLYKPLGNDKKLTKATVTVPPELVQLRAQFKETSAKLEDTTIRLNASQAKVSELEKKLAESEAIQADLNQLLSDAQLKYNALDLQHQQNIEQLKIAIALSDEQVLKTSGELQALKQEAVDASSKASAAAVSTVAPVVVTVEDKKLDAALKADVARLELENSKLSQELAVMRELLTGLTDDLGAQVAKNHALSAEMLKLSKEAHGIGSEALTLYEKYQELERELETRQNALDAAHREIELQKARVEALELGRGLLMTAVDTANQDTDAKQLEINTLKKEVERLNAALASGSASAVPACDTTAVVHPKADEQLQAAYMQASMEVARLSTMVEKLTEGKATEGDLQHQVWRRESENAALRWLMTNIIDERDSLASQVQQLRK